MLDFGIGRITRRGWYWEEFSDDDLLYLKKSHEALVANCEYEISKIVEELHERKSFDANISRL